MPLRRLSGALGRLLASLGRFLGASWAIVGRSWPLLGWLGPLLECIFPPRDSPSLDFRGFGGWPGLVLEPSGAYFGMRFAAPRTLKPNAFIHAVTTFFRLQALCILSLPVRRSVRSTWNLFKSLPKSTSQKTCNFPQNLV